MKISILKSLILLFIKIYGLKFNSIKYSDINYQFFKCLQRCLGFNNYESFIKSGEQWLIKNLNEIQNRKNTVFFDVGANKGDFTKLILKYHPNATVFAFEPNKKLINNFPKSDRIKLFNIALGNEIKKEDMVFYNDTCKSTIIYDVHEQLYRSKKHYIEKIDILTIDFIKNSEKIDTIDFLKIDVEGYEYEVLLGAMNSIENNEISIIQFEFNIMNLFRKIRFLDFKNLLKNYKFFRLLPDGLLEVNDYLPDCEVYEYQNIICLKK